MIDLISHYWKECESANFKLKYFYMKERCYLQFKKRIVGKLFQCIPFCSDFELQYIVSWSFFCIIIVLSVG